MEKNIQDILKVKVDESYKWKDTLLINDNFIKDCKENEEYKGEIIIKYKNNIDYLDSREISDGLYACDAYFFDKKKGCKIYSEDKNKYIIETNQECNEWLIIIMQIMLLQNNFSFIHAAAVEKNGAGYMFPSWGGVGKTACVSKLIENGYKLLGDDLNIIDENGMIYGFPKKFVLYFYHKKLFPDIFKEKSVKCNNVLNNFYNKIIPVTKATLRKIPGALTFARKHNPQSMKVSPYKIFGKEKISDKAKVNKIIWLERNKSESKYVEKDPKEIALKATAVTLNEIFSDNLNAILIMCGFSIFKYDEIFVRAENIYLNFFQNISVGMLNVKKDIDVENVPKEVLKII